MISQSSKPIDLATIVDEPDFANELLDAADELRAMGMMSLAAAVQRAHTHLGFAEDVAAPPASGTFTTKDAIEFAGWRQDVLAAEGG